MTSTNEDAAEQKKKRAYDLYGFIRSKRFKRWTIALYLLGAIDYIWLQSLTRQNHPPDNLPQQRSLLHSQRPFEEVVVPFTDWNGKIIVEATLAGTPVECMVDTGVRDIVWQNLNLPGQQIADSFQYPHPTGDYEPAQWFTLPDLRLGDFELQQVWTVHIDSRHPALIWTPDNHPIQAILGNYAFKNLVLTIDYAQKILILRNSEYNIAKQSHRPQDCLLDVKPTGKDIEYSPECLTVSGSLEGHPVVFVVDTGHYAPGILVSPLVREQLSSVPPGMPPSFRYGIFDQFATEVTRPLQWKIGNIEGQAVGLVTSLWPGQQALLGYDVLKNYRVTIDYPRLKMLLEPYDSKQTTTVIDSEFNRPRIINSPPIPPGYCRDILPDGTVHEYPCAEESNHGK